MKRISTILIALAVASCGVNKTDEQKGEQANGPEGANAPKALVAMVDTSVDEQNPEEIDFVEIDANVDLNDADAVAAAYANGESAKSDDSIDDATALYGKYQSNRCVRRCWRFPILRGIIGGAARVVRGALVGTSNLLGWLAGYRPVYYNNNNYQSGYGYCHTGRHQVGKSQYVVYQGNTNCGKGAVQQSPYQQKQGYQTPVQTGYKTPHQGKYMGKCSVPVQRPFQGVYQGKYNSNQNRGSEVYPYNGYQYYPNTGVVRPGTTITNGNVNTNGTQNNTTVGVTNSNGTNVNVNNNTNTNTNPNGTVDMSQPYYLVDANATTNCTNAQ